MYDSALGRALKYGNIYKARQNPQTQDSVTEPPPQYESEVVAPVQNLNPQPSKYSNQGGLSALQRGLMHYSQGWSGNGNRRGTTSPTNGVPANEKPEYFQNETPGGQVRRAISSISIPQQPAIPKTAFPGVPSGEAGGSTSYIDRYGGTANTYNRMNYEGNINALGIPEDLQGNDIKHVVYRAMAGLDPADPNSASVVVQRLNEQGIPATLKDNGWNDTIIMPDGNEVDIRTEGGQFWYGEGDGGQGEGALPGMEFANTASLDAMGSPLSQALLGQGDENMLAKIMALISQMLPGAKKDETAPQVSDVLGARL